MIVELSKKLSYILRHDPESIGAYMDSAGWVDVREILSALKIDRNILNSVVDNNNKKRFEYSSDGKKIRARQGHSVNVNLGYKPVSPPKILYHGTGSKTIETIRRQGIQKMDRHHVHLSPDKKTALSVGSRHGKPFIFEINAERMNEDGYIFYKTGNNVWLVDYVPPEYIKN